MSRREEDGGRLARALADLGLTSPTALTLLEREVSAPLWDAFIDARARHYMLLPIDAWPESSAPLIERPLPDALGDCGVWLVFWMRERACVIPAAEFEARLDELLMCDDEGMIAINTSTLDALLSVGGHGQIRITRRPAEPMFSR